MSGDEERVSKRARKNYPGEVSFGALSKEENEHSVAQVSRCTDTGNCTWTEDGTKPQLLGGLGEEGGGGSSLQQMVEEEFGELSFLLGEPQFIADDTEVEGGEVAMYEVVETRGDNHEDRGRGLQGQHFLLDSVLYSEFNAIGQAQFNILATKGLDSQCWRQAVASIEADCETMTHTRKQRLAVQLNNCHLQHAGRRPTRCGIRDSDEQCVQETQHDDVAFQSYTTFFHHVNAICHHLSHTLWQEQTEGLVRGLTASSLATFDRTKQSLEKQELVLRGQELASEQSKEIADGLSDASLRLNGLSDSLSMELTATVTQIAQQEAVLVNLLRVQNDAAEQASSVLNELGSAKSELASYMETIETDRRATMDQNMALADTIGFIHDCLANASSAWARFQSFTYMILAVNLCWVLTTAPPLRPARTTLFALVALGLLLERYLCEDNGRAGTVALPEWLVSGLELATRGSFTEATWTRVFLQEKIRWMTFQVGAAVLAHTLVAHCFPSLALGRIVDLLRRSMSKRNEARLPSPEHDDESKDCAAQSPRRRNAGGRRDPNLPPQEHTAGTTPPRLCAGLGGGGGSSSNGDRMHDNVREVTPMTSRSSPEGYRSSLNGGGSQESAERVGKGRWTSESGRGGAACDGLDDLSRQELQALAKKTGGLVKGNRSTVEIIRGLRNAGYIYGVGG